MGAGRNAIHLAALGFEVDAVDISTVAVERGRSSASEAGVAVNFIAADLEHGLPDGVAANYALIAIVRYVNLRLVAELAKHLAPGGYLFVEEHLVTQHDVAGPKSPSHRLRRGELSAALAGLEPVFYREGLVRDPDGRTVSLAQAIATHGGIAELEYC